MSTTLLLGGNFPVSNSLTTHGQLASSAVGTSVEFSLIHGIGSVTVSVMLETDEKETYQNVVVTDEAQTVDIPDGTTYVEFNIQKVVLDDPVESGVFAMNMWAD